MKNRFFAAIVFSAALAACETVPSADGSSLDNPELKTAEILRTFTFPAKDNSGQPLARSTIEDAVKQAFIEASQFDELVTFIPKCKTQGARVPKYTTGLFTGFAVARKDAFSRGNPDIFEVRYQNYTNYGNPRVFNGSSVSIVFEEHYEIAGDAINVGFSVFDGPKRNIFVSIDPCLGIIPPLGSKDEILADALNALQTASPIIIRREIVSDEFDTPYPAESVLASFERLWQPIEADSIEANKYGSEFDKLSDRADLFIFDFNGVAQPISISVYPYREGSKVTYEIAYGYKLADGNKNEFDSRDIDSLKTEISKVALD